MYWYFPRNVDPAQRLMVTAKQQASWILSIVLQEDDCLLVRRST